MSNTETNWINTYFLFGSDAVKVYKEQGINAVVEQYEDNTINFDTETIQEGQDMSTFFTLLKMYGDCTTITEEEYNLL